MNDPLDRILLEDAARALPDEGFTLRVMGALPDRPAAARPWLRPLLVFGSAALGSILAVLLSPAAGSMLEGYLQLMRAGTITPGVISGLAISLALLASAVILAVDTD